MTDSADRLAHLRAIVERVLTERSRSYTVSYGTDIDWTEGDTDQSVEFWEFPPWFCGRLTPTALAVLAALGEEMEETDG